MTREEMIKNYMNKYDCSREEAISIIEEDEETDHMTMAEINATLTKEQREAIKSAIKTTSETKERKKVVRERKKDDLKVEIINKLSEFSKEFGENVEILKPEREITFTINGENYSIQLIKHRNAKK